MADTVSYLDMNRHANVSQQVQWPLSCVHSIDEQRLQAAHVKADMM